MDDSPVMEPGSAPAIAQPEDRVLTLVRIGTELVTIFILIDIATHGDMAGWVRRRWATTPMGRAQRWWRGEQAIRRDACHLVFETMMVLEAEWRLHHDHG